MSRSIKISEKAARAIWRHWEGCQDNDEADAFCAIRDALATLNRKRPPGVSHKSRRSSPELMQAFAVLLPEHKSRKPTKWALDAKAARALSKAERRDETAAIRAACWIRCDGICECGCGRPVHYDAAGIQADWNAQAELEHPFSKGRGARLPQSVETCWILRADCHRDRHAARPDAATWWRKFIEHCLRCYEASVAAGTAATTNYSVAEAEARKRLAFVETRSTLPASPRTTERHRQEAEEKILELESKVHKAVFTEEGNHNEGAD